MLGHGLQNGREVGHSAPLGVAFDAREHLLAECDCLAINLSLNNLRTASGIRAVRVVLFGNPLVCDRLDGLLQNVAELAHQPEQLLMRPACAVPESLNVCVSPFRHQQDILHLPVQRCPSGPDCLADLALVSAVKGDEVLDSIPRQAEGRLVRHERVQLVLELLEKIQTGDKLSDTCTCKVRFKYAQKLDSMALKIQALLEDGAWLQDDGAVGNEPPRLGIIVGLLDLGIEQSRPARQLKAAPIADSIAQLLVQHRRLVGLGGPAALMPLVHMGVQLLNRGNGLCQRVVDRHL